MIARSTRAAARVRLGAAAFWSWWSGELVGLFPQAWHTRNRARIEAHVIGSSIELKILRPSKPPRIAVLEGAELQPDGALQVLRREKSKLPVWLFPPAAAILSRRIQIPRSAAASFSKLLALEADRWTPYRAEEIAVAWRELPNNQETKAEIDLRFIPLSAIEQWLQSLALIELLPSVAVLGPTEGFHAPLHVMSTRKGKSRSWLGLASLALASASLLFLVTDWIVAQHEREAWQRAVEIEQHDYAVQRDLERRIGNLLTASAEQTNSVTRFSRGTLLASTAAILPGTDWFVEVAVRKNVLTLRGYAEKPELLLKALEPLAKSREVSLQGELAFDAKLDRRRFTIGFQPGGVHD